MDDGIHNNRLPMLVRDLTGFVEKADIPEKVGATAKGCWNRHISRCRSYCVTYLCFVEMADIRIAVGTVLMTLTRAAIEKMDRGVHTILPKLGWPSKSHTKHLRPRSQVVWKRVISQ